MIIQGIEVEVADTMWQRMRGLIGRPAPESGKGLLIPRCNAIHTCFMRYSIDVMFFDSKGKIVKIVRNVRPWRFFVWGGFSARFVVETATEENKS